MLEKVQATDRQTYPVAMIPKVLFTKYRPSVNALAVYVALKLRHKYASIPAMAALMDISEGSFKKGTAELVKKGVVRVRHRTRKTAGGNRRPLANAYEIVDLDLSEE
jgi:predicted ArsR family transcriptional regulator